MARFKTQYTDNQSTLEVSSSETLTVPDMSFSVKEILTRFTRGTVTPDELYRSGYYDDEPDIDNPIEAPQDLTDYEARAEKGRQILADLERQMKTEATQIVTVADTPPGAETGPDSSE